MFAPFNIFLFPFRSSFHCVEEIDFIIAIIAGMIVGAAAVIAAKQFIGTRNKAAVA